MLGSLFSLFKLVSLFIFCSDSFVLGFTALLLISVGGLERIFDIIFA